MEIVVGDWRITPYPGNTCWQLQRRKRKHGKGKDEWERAHKYPSDLVHAFSLIREQERRESPSVLSIDADDVVSKLRAMDAEFVERVRKALDETGG